MKAVLPIEAIHREARRAPLVVEAPLLRVTESEETADPGAIADALELLVKWAVRAHTRCSPSMGDVAGIAKVASIGVGKQA